METSTTKATPTTTNKNQPNRELQEALDKSGFSNIQCLADLGFFGWIPPPRNTKKGAPYRYKSPAKATVEEIKGYILSGMRPDVVVETSALHLPVEFKSNIPKQIVVQKFPYGQIGVGALYHAHSRCDLESLHFYFGCSALEVLSAEKKKGRKDSAPFYVMKVPGTKMIMVHYSLNFGQDYSPPGFQFERLMTGKRLDERHSVGFIEHVQLMKIGHYRVLMSAETDAIDSEGHPAEIKLMKQGYGGTRTFFQMVGSGSLTLHRGKNEKGRLTKVTTVTLETMAQSISDNHDVNLLESKLIRNMERLKELDHQGHFDQGKAYRIDFNNSKMELHRIPAQHPLLPPAAVVKELIGIKK